MLFVYTNVDHTYSASVLGENYSFPIFIWATVPMIILFLATLGHMMFYGILNFFKEKSLKSDYDKFVTMISNSLMENPIKLKFKNQEIQKLASLFENSTIITKNNDFETGIEKIDKVLKNQKNLASGDTIKLKDFSLDENNKYLLQNYANKVENDIKFAKEVVTNSYNFHQNIVTKACKKLFSTNNPKSIMLVLNSSALTKEILFEALEMDKNIFSIENDDLINIVAKLKLTVREYILFAQFLKDTQKPDELINIFEKLSNKDENAMESYIYVLLIFEMVDKVKDILSSSENDDLLIFKAYLNLKESNSEYNLDKFLLGLL
jgi:hypothetical protein